jgi:ElaB/YqjD/DUF883 family membrane-anchored ribosome-binding protein
MEQESRTTRPESAAMWNQTATSPSTLGGKVEMLEQGFRDTAHEAATAVTDTAAAVKAAVGEAVDEARAAVGETADVVKRAMHGAADGLKRVFDLRSQVRRHPWLTLGGAVLVGYVVASFIRLRRP